MTPGSDRPSTGTAEDAGAELQRLREERDAALAARTALEHRLDRRQLWRRVLAGALVVLFAVLLPIAVTATWAHRTVLDTDTYVSTVAPIASDPAVTAAVSRQVTDQLYEALDPQAVIADALPPRAAFLATPIANGAKGSVADAVNKVLSSSQFQQLWENANRTAHARLVAVLRGDSTVVQSTNGQVVLNLVPILNAALQNAADFVAGVVGRPVTLPTISSSDLPSAACRKVSAALDRPLPDTCGQIALFPAAKLENAQRAVRAFDRGVLALLIVTPLLFLGALAASPRRRRTLLQLTVGGLLGLVVVRRVVMWQQDQLVTTGRPENKAARTAILDGLLNGFFDVTVWFLVAGLVLVALALLTGPYAFAVRTRAVVAATGRVVGAAATGTVGGPQDQEAVGWVRRHFDVLRLTGVAVALLVLLAVDVNVWGFLLLAGLLALYEAGLHRLRPPSSITLPPSPPPQPAA